MGLQQLLHFPQALVKDGLVQLRVGRYLRDAIKGGGGGAAISEQDTVIHAYTITTQQKGGLQYTIPLWRPFGHSLGVLGVGNPP